MNHKNSSTDNKPHANPANFEMIDEKKNKIRPIPTLFQNCLQPIYRYYYLKNNSIIIYIDLIIGELKIFQKFHNFVSRPRTRDQQYLVSRTIQSFFFSFFNDCADLKRSRLFAF